jgi:hypothetical protein
VSNPLGLASLVTTSGAVFIPVTGMYCMNFAVTFNVLIGATAGSAITVSLRKNDVDVVTRATYAFPLVSTAGTTNSIGAYFVCNFQAGDRISVGVFNTTGATTNVLGPAVSGSPPFNTFLSVVSLF